MRVIEERCLRYADAIITVSDPIASYLNRFNPTTQVIYNCPRNRDIPRLSKKEARTELGLPLDDFIVTSVGTIRLDCRFDLLLAVARLTWGEKIRYVVVGDGPLAHQLNEDAKKVSGSIFTVIPSVPRKKALSYVLASDLTWAVYQHRMESMNPRMTIPWKFFESLACGVPLIVESGTYRAKLVSMFDCGSIVEEDSPAKVSQLILSMAKNPDYNLKLSMNARSASQTMKFDWETMSAKLVGIYERLQVPVFRVN
jgi:glycosyltransferase involved in cell wall biosynthesis